MSQSQIRHAALQKKLDALDELIDTLEREKAKEHDDDLRDTDEAKEVLQMARADYSKGELQRAWLETERAEYCVYFGRQDLNRWKEVVAAIDKVLK